MSFDLLVTRKLIKITEGILTNTASFIPSATVIRWGIIGCGNVTEIKSGPAYQQTAGFSLHAVMRRDAAKAQDYARRHQVPLWFSDADALINHPDIDAVYIATPPDSHLLYALKVAAAGKICCVEKPMALDEAECNQMITAFEQAGKPLFVAYYRRSLPRFLQVQQWLQQGLIGQVRHVHWAFSRSPNPADVAGATGWRTDPAQAGGGYFVDLASHGLDLLMFLLGDITQVQGMAFNQQGIYPAEDAVTACWQFAAQPNGSKAFGSGYWNFAADKRRDEVEIIGSAGSIRFSVFDEAPLQLITASENITPDNNPIEKHALENSALEGVRSEVITSENGGSTTILVQIDHPPHIQHFHVQNIARHLAEQGQHPSTGHTAKRATAVMAQILQSK
jgi:1,5-anhydro-D-fructose reductase (1,5-anhydro-D-mannitol-forming)